METEEQLAMKELKSGDPPPEEVPKSPEEPRVSSTSCEDTENPIQEETPEEIPLEPP